MMNVLQGVSFPTQNSKFVAIFGLKANSICACRVYHHRPLQSVPGCQEFKMCDIRFIIHLQKFPPVYSFRADVY